MCRKSSSFSCLVVLFVGFVEDCWRFCPLCLCWLSWSPQRVIESVLNDLLSLQAGIILDKKIVMMKRRRRRRMICRSSYDIEEIKELVKGVDKLLKNLNSKGVPTSIEQLVSYNQRKKNKKKEYLGCGEKRHCIK